MYVNVIVPNDQRKVIVSKLGISIEGRPDVELDLTGSLPLSFSITCSHAHALSFVCLFLSFATSLFRTLNRFRLSIAWFRL